MDTDRSPIVPKLPKPLVTLLTFVEFIDYFLSAVPFLLGLNPSFAERPLPWDYEAYGYYTVSNEPSTFPSAVAIKRRLRAVAHSRLATTCSVCLCEVEAGHAVRELVNCRHAFHKQCIDAWIDLGKLTCPLCRARLLPGEKM